MLSCRGRSTSYAPSYVDSPKTLYLLFKPTQTDCAKYSDQAQGGGQAIEDGVSMGVLFSGDVTVDSVPSILRLYQQVRHERSSTMQRLSKEAGVGDDKFHRTFVKTLSISTLLTLLHCLLHPI